MIIESRPAQQDRRRIEFEGRTGIGPAIGNCIRIDDAFFDRQDGARRFVITLTASEVLRCVRYLPIETLGKLTAEQALAYRQMTIDLLEGLE